MHIREFSINLLVLLLGVSILCAQTSFRHVDSLILVKKYSEAEIILKSGSFDNRSNEQYLELLGDALSYQLKWEEAAKSYSKLVDLDGYEANYHYKLGGALAMYAKNSNKFKALTLVSEIKESFKRCLELDPGHINGHWALIELYLELPGLLGGSKEKALDYAESLGKTSPVDGYLAKGYVYEASENFEKAEYFYVKAVEVGGSETCFSKLQSLYEKNNQPQKAIKTAELNQLKYQRNVMYYQIGRICAANNIHLEKGLNCLLTYIENYNPTDSVSLEWAYYRLSQIMKHKKLRQQELKYLNKVLKIDPNFNEALERMEAIQTN